MNTAITHYNTPIHKQNAVEKVGYRFLDNDPSGKNHKRLSIILHQHHEDVDVFSLFGWDGLPEKLKQAVKTDMEAYRDELLGLYSSRDIGVRNRRNRVVYWIKAYMDAICSEETALQALQSSL